MIRLIGLSLAAGLLSAVLFLSLAKGFAAGMILSYVAPLPLMLAGLSLGWRMAAASGLAAMAAVAAVAGGLSALPFAVTAVLPSVVVARQALLWRGSADGAVEWYPPGLLLGWLTALVCGLVVLGALLVPSGEAGIEGWVRETVGQTVGMVAPTVPAEDRAKVVGWWVPFFPAMVAGSWLVMSVANAAAAQGILARQGKSRRPSPAYRKLTLPVWLGVFLLVACAAAMTGGDLGYVARSLAVVALLPFALLGIATVHGKLAVRPHAGLLLAVFYGVLVVAFGWAVVAVAGLGLVKFLSMFRRPATPGGGKEE